MLLCIIACSSHPSIPDNYSQDNRLPNIFPDYTDVTIPCNIAPLNFSVHEGADECVARFTFPGGEYTYGKGYKVIINEDEWKEMLASAKGKSIKVDVFAKQNGQWKCYKAFSINVAEEEIDPYISYRLIQPSYVAYEVLTISQRNITNFEEVEIYNNMLVAKEDSGQCINCHSYKNFKTDNMQFHMRQYKGGTIIVNNGKVSKVDLKTDSTISAGVYPSWHPTKNLIAYSTNNTGQSFHTRDKAKIEVQDTHSDLILYDLDKNEVTNIANDPNELEVFPTWSPDGKTLYYCSAHFEYQDTVANETEMIQRFKEVKYDIYKRPFNPETKQWGVAQRIYAPSEADQSATLPRISPDGKYMLFAQGNWGCFHIWHPEADIYIMDLKSNKVRKLENANSERAESYPVWSSNGRWVMMATRRDDSNYSRAAIAYFDKQGRCHKAFEVPQKDPDYYTYFLKSYNRPEFMVEPVSIKPQEFASAAKSEAKKVNFKSK